MSEIPDVSMPENNLAINSAMRYFSVFTGLQAQGNLAAVQLVATVPDQVQQVKTNKVNTCVYIAPAIGDHFHIRWFNNGHSIERCGHGTLAAAALLHSLTRQQEFAFSSEKEWLHVRLQDGDYTLKLPQEKIQTVSPSKQPLLGLLGGIRAEQTPAASGYLVIELDNAQAVQEFQLSQMIVATIERRALIVTATSDLTSADIVFRYFAPQYGKNEDSATGSAASLLWPFWRNRFRQPTLRVYQCSPSGGRFRLSAADADNVEIAGSVIEKRL